MDNKTNEESKDVLPTVVSLFAGCGGSSLGYRMAGYKELLAVDFDAAACDTFRMNFPGVPCLQADITKTSADDLMRAAGIAKGELDVLDGSPPCQGFSMAGRRNVTDSRNQMYEHFARLIEGTQPRAFVMENVASMSYGKMRGAFNEILARLNATDYQVRARILNAQYYGVPQSRKRLFFLGTRSDMPEPAYPVPSNRTTSFIEAIWNIVPKEYVKLNGIYLEMWRRMQPDDTFKKVHPKGHGFNLRKIRPDKPSPTVTATFSIKGWRFGGLLHHSKPRSLSIEEVKRVCSFPDDFAFPASLKFEQKWKLLGNAVMPLQMRAVALAMKEGVLDKAVETRGVL